MNQFILRCPLLLFVSVTLVTPTSSSADEKPPLPTADQLPAIPQLPDPFRFSDGTTVKTRADWERRRAEIKELLLHYEYGHPAPEFKDIKAEIMFEGPDEATGGIHRTLHLTMGPDGKISTTVELAIPPGNGPFPLIVKGDLCWGKVKPAIVTAVIKRGYALAQFDRTTIAPDNKSRDKGVLAAYADADEGDLAAWAWGFSRVIDYLRVQTFVDRDKIIATGHSRGGKAALLAGALDAHIALTVPNGSGTGGAAPFRLQNSQSESLGQIVLHFPYWFGPGLSQFSDCADRLPFDQHELLALVAPRALLNTEGFGDFEPNGPGTQQTMLAAAEVYRFLGASENIGMHWREGKHEHNLEDFAALMDFADHVLRGRPSIKDFKKLPFPNEPRSFTWKTPMLAGQENANVKPIDQLPPIPQLPDPFLFPDGSRVQTRADWDRRRQQIKELFLTYEYGHPAPDPGNVIGETRSQRIDPITGVMTREVLLHIGDAGKILANVILTIPPGQQRFPIIIKGDMCWSRMKAEYLTLIVQRKYAVAEFDRTQFAPDNVARDTGVLAAYPEADQGDLVAWAWGFSRVVDYLEKQDFVAKDKIIVTGHSRGGKAALLAGALDERVALTVPNGSGAAGAGCFRVKPPGAETLERIITTNPNWFGPHFGQFIGHVEHLPFDQHELRALVAPRALLNTEGFGDRYANGPGSEQAYLAAKEVYRFLGVPEKIGIHFREGKHDQNLEDYAALLDFADSVLNGKPATFDSSRRIFPDEPMAFTWAAPKTR